MNQSGLHEGVGWAHLAKSLAVDARHRLPVLDASHEDPGSHDVAERGPKLAKRPLNPIEDEARLEGRVADSDDPVGAAGGGPRNQNPIANPYRSRVSSERLVGGAGRDVLALHSPSLALS